MDLEKVYQEVDYLLDQLDFNALWNGFHKFPFALYNEKEACLNHKVFPKPDFFYGNTAIQYNQEIIAIWNLELDEIDDMDILAANLVHEMFHCFQMENQEDRYPDDIELLFSPITEKYCSLRYKDSKLLVKSYEHPNIEILQNIFYVRKKMIDYDPQSSLNEVKAETIEGTAEYVSSKALKALSLSKYLKQMEVYSKKLISLELQLDPRRRSYYSGVFLYSLLESLSIDFKVFYGVSIFHNVMTNIKPKYINIKNYRSIYKQIENHEKECSKEYALIKDLIENGEYIEFPSRIVGYDPMNMFVKNNFIFCSSYVSLSNGKEERKFYQHILLKVFRTNAQTKVKGYYLRKVKV
ncbi:MAG: hypothetical protein K2M08_03285 [Anaeroplasmataceae bacterium]|nr:hypothetical protein [Anaeroplasmataceae bacterium]